MVTSLTGAQSPSVLAGLSPQQTSPSGSTASFTDQLAAELEGFLSKAGGGSNLEIDIQSTPSQNSGVRQFIVTVKNSDNAPAQTAASTATSAFPTIQNVAPQTTSVQTPSVQTPSVQAALSPTLAQAPSAQAPAAQASPPKSFTLAEVDAYWAAQPPAVQKLRDVTDYSEKNALAQQLADQGYTIDREIMVFGWDPVNTMQTRLLYGYTWAPSWNQPMVSTPGMALPGQTPYDPQHPPPGSILVNTDFANGLDSTDASA